MSARSTKPSATLEPLDDATHAERNITMGFAFTRQILDDPSLLDAIPDGATLILIPGDDPALAEANLAMAIGEVRKGRNVYIRHVRLADLPT
ncbi:MAG: DUF5647 family protein [Thermomicrobiales bacterium]